MMHDLVKDGDSDVFPQITDRNGQVCLSYCRRCKRGEGQLGPSCTDETDEELRERIHETRDGWGAFLSIVNESSGSALDDCARSVGLERRRLP